jgi:hypothetical protein
MRIAELVVENLDAVGFCDWHRRLLKPEPRARSSRSRAPQNRGLPQQIRA